MKNFYNKEEFNLKDITDLIQNEVEESIYLEFKEAGALDKAEGKRKEITKDVSAFANSDGGIIVYGIKEQNHRASSLTYIDGNEFSKEWLEQVINSGVQRHIPDVRIFPIRHEGKIENSIYVVKIPKSTEAPHINRDKRFYKRFNFESVIMEEYEIRQLYDRKTKTKLEVGGLISLKEESSKENVAKFSIEASVVNWGDVAEKDYKLNFYFDKCNDIRVLWDRIYTNHHFTRMSPERLKLTAVGVNPIFPGETVNAIRFEIEIPNEVITLGLEGWGFEIKLFYSNGESGFSGKLIDLIGSQL